MQGMFRANGGCGYVKKPDFLLNASPSGVFYPTVDPVVVKTLKVFHATTITFPMLPFTDLKSA